VTCVHHGSSAKWRRLWSQTLSRQWGIYFLTADGSSPIEIYRRLRNVYGDDSINVSSVRHWARRFERGEKEISDRPRSGRPATAATMENTEKVDALIRDSHRNTSELCTATGIGKSAVMAVIKNMATEKLAQGRCRKRLPQNTNQPEKNL